ncbi:Tar ligand binding domain-containing protein [Paraburkholderia sp. LEh10]|uniref:methyl-accepting chemotaxis protein n=1 Tax=Paraburkholderia sp. LEh10 TaxID=2821353 RepID=UPI001AE492A5|nr:methyl-accepting chemotaxis protein [Paraburkholderia sp. LEh10]MBP0589507.1 Tar ligand binding domain-containing protein [Paraburkholderia sp. LEh10]
MIASFSIKTRIAIAMAALSLLLLVVGVLGLVGMTSSNEVGRVSYGERLPGAIAIGDTMTYVLRQRVTLDRAMLVEDEQKVRSLLGLAGQMKAHANDSWGRYASLPKSSEERQLADAVASKMTAVGGIYDKLAAAIAAKDKQQTVDISDAGFRMFVEFQKSCDQLNDYRTQSTSSEYQHSESVFSTFRVVTVLALVAGLGSALVAYLKIGRAIGAPLNLALEQIGKVARGDLSQRIEMQTRDEMGLLLQSLEEMRQGLVATVEAVRSGSEAIGLAAQEISAGNTNLSARTEEQAASLQETAAGMGEISGGVKLNADSAHEASQVANIAMTSAENGQQTMRGVTAIMSNIRAQSESMADIIAIIEGIAFQTNILALNAAVEAARAGEQGRGFAVVAGEVRTLAQRSSNAAKEVKGLIESSGQLVRDGSELVSKAGGSMSNILSDVRRVTDFVGEISNASREQSSNIGEIAQAVSQIDEVTQQNAALVEQVAAAAQALEDLTRQLQDSVSAFRLPA